ncbi:Omp28 family outer membrane lipoprotein [Prevotella dentasini]|uniref:Omp28 family outer membrane lipoprotein n=1 Tax=Prevotella dentasini TaxID=589537 RepID=UPI00046AB06E|nr:Omp28 family outer membrane lipoprotein [Prevotella dentasini]
MKRIATAILSLAALFLASCDRVGENERFEYQKPQAAARAVLVEDFTGQKCINCPKAHEEIEKMQEQYGKDNVIAVAIHSGPLALKPSARLVGLWTALGEEYYKSWGVEAEPTGLVNRVSGVINYPEWAGAVRAELQRPAPVAISVNADVNAEGSMGIKVSALASENISGKLQLWVVEDGIVAMQSLPDGSVDREYVQNNVLRAAVNGAWGTDISIKEGETKVQDFTFRAEEGWKLENLAIVAFIYGDGGVKQVVRQPLSMK